MSTVTRHALRVYAALAELKGADDDVLDALIPFFEPVLSVMKGRVFDPHVFSAGVRRLYRWRFTGDVASQFVPRLERKGFLRKEISAKDGAIWIVQYDDNMSGEDSPTILSAFERIIDEFSTFPPKVTDLLSYNRSRDELKDMLIRFLVTMDAQGEGAFAPQLGGLEPGGETTELLAGLEEGGRALEPNDRYMCARFVTHIIRRRREFIPHLSRLASIALLTEVVEDFLKPTRVEAKSDLTIVLDAPIALDFLGCSGKHLKDDIVTIVRSLKLIGVKFVVFPISCLEMQRNLRSMLALPRDRRHGYTHTALLNREIDEDVVRAIANNPERALQEAGITVRQNSLDTYPNSHRYFTADQYEDFFSSILWGNDVPAREHDATCAALIMRLREGRQSSDVFKCGFVMVTRNHTFVRNVRSYCIQGRMINEMQEGPVIHQRELATTAWLRTGLGADEAIPRGHLVATCERVLQLRPEVRSALAAQLTKLTPERLEQFNVLIQDARSVRTLADRTLNNENVVTADNARQLLDVMREAMVDELTETHEAELASIRDELKKSSDEASSQIEKLTGEIRRLNDEQSHVAAREAQQVEAIALAMNKRAWWIEVLIATVLILLGAFGALNYMTGIVDNSKVWNAILALAGALGVVRLIFTVLERTLPGLSTLLTAYVRSSTRKQLALLGLSENQAAKSLEFRKGRIVVDNK
jgi:hypothetical protein